VCVCLDAFVPHTDYLDVWRFITATRVWERVNTTSPNEARPYFTNGHAMTSVGLDLWVHGGETGRTKFGEKCPTCYDPPFVSDEVWRFSTSTRGWERVDKIAVNEARPSTRHRVAMTSVGLDLWLLGGIYDDSGDGDSCSSLATLMWLLCVLWYVYGS